MSTPRYCQPGPLSIHDGKVFDQKGDPFTFQGVSWFGFEGSGGLFDGLDKADGFGHDLDSALVRDWKVVAARIKLLGFNSIRMPFAFSVCRYHPMHFWIDLSCRRAAGR
jgi:aryl-phospho-beta-D-glucosidase BglC (GH1 family)